MKIEDIKTGDLGVSSSTTLLGRSIQKFQKKQNKEYGKYNHGFVFWWYGKKLFVIEAMANGIILSDFEIFYLNNNKISDILVLKPKIYVDETKIGYLMLPFIGHAKYDYKSLIFEQSIKMLTKKWTGEKTENTKDFTCAEFCAYIYNEYFKGFETIFEKQTQVAPVDLCLNSFFTHEKIK